MKKNNLIFSILLILFSCGDVYVPYQIGIDNKTNDTVKIYFFGNSAYTQGVDSVICLPNTKTVYSDHSGRALKDGCYTGINKDEVIVMTNNGKNLKKDIANLSNWECIGSYSAGWIMIFIIVDSDLE